MMREYSVKITVAGTTYQDDDLIFAKSIKFVMLNKQLFTLKNGDYTFDSLTGTLEFLTIELQLNDSLVFMFKK